MQFYTPLEKPINIGTIEKINENVKNYTNIVLNIQILY